MRGKKQTPFQKHCRKLYASFERRFSEKSDKNGRIIRHGIAIPFTVEQLEKWLDDKFIPKNLDAPKTQGDWIPCKYCGVAIFWQTCAIDHETPIKRGGGPGLDNLDCICRECNQEKGGLMPPEYVLLRSLLRAEFCKDAITDIESRLKKANKLAASVNWFRKKKK